MTSKDELRQYANRIRDAYTLNEAESILTDLIEARERKSYRRGQLNPACQLCKKPLKLAAQYHKECWSKAVDQYNSAHLSTNKEGEE